MTSAQFWTLISRLDGVPAPRRLARLTAELAAGDPDRITGFADDLAEAAHLLDTPAHMQQTVRDVGEPEHARAIPMSPDVFLYARLAVVAAGEAVWARAAADPTALAGTWHVADAEDLLAVAPQAWEQATGTPWTHETPVSVETGTNTAAWGEAADVGLLPRRRWLAGGGTFDPGILCRPVYDSAWSLLTQAVAADEAWTRWWAAANVPELELNPRYRRGRRERPRVRKGRNSVRVECTLDGTRLETEDRAELVELAARDLITLLELTRQRLDLPALPPLPPVDQVPASVPDAYTGPPEGPEEIIRTLVEQMGLSVEEARAIVVGGGH